jgi:hypothetical protein
MSAAQSRVTGLHRLALGQRRFKSGALYVSGIYSGADLEAIDVRYFVENGSQVTPTRQGFRIRADNLAAFAKVLRTQDCKLVDAELWRGSTRKLIARYCTDEYGTGVDIRYFSDSARYKGWEPRGIRLQLEDFLKLRATLLKSGVIAGRIDPKADLFEGKEITAHARKQREKGADQRRGEAGIPALFAVNEALKAFIEDR